MCRGQKFLNFYSSRTDKYFSFPMIVGRVKKSDFASIMDRINSKLAGWNMNLLSRVGRVTLAKSVLVTIPSYTMQNLWLPEGICDNIDARIRNFT